MRIVARAAPQAAATVARAGAERKLLDMTDDFERASWRALRQGIAIDRECVFQSLPGEEVAQLGDARGSEQMALLADAVAGRRFEFRRINDRACAGIGEVPFRRAMATFAGDRFCGKDRRSILIQSARDVQRGSRMAENTFFADRTREIGIGHIFVAGRQVIGFAAGIEGHRRLEQMPADVNEIAAGMISGANHVVHAIVTAIAAVLPVLPIAGGRRMHGDRRAMRAQRAFRFLGGAPQRMGHRRAAVALDLSRVAEHATTRSGGRARQSLRKGLRGLVGRGVAIGLASSANNAAEDNQEDRQA